MIEKDFELIATPLTDNCHSSYEKKSHAIIGISPFNSYFNEERIYQLAQWALREFKGIHLFVPDGPSAYTLEALGYSPEKAAHKARRQSNYLHNKIRKALGRLDFTEEKADALIINWEKLNANDAYKNILKEVHQNTCGSISFNFIESRNNSRTFHRLILHNLRFRS